MKRKRFPFPIYDVIFLRCQIMKCVEESYQSVPIDDDDDDYDDDEYEANDLNNEKMVH